MTGPGPQRLLLVLSGRSAFESLVGPVPEDLRARFHFQKPRNALRIHALLSRSRLVISKSYRRPEPNRWILAARRRGIPTLLVVDGPLEWSNLYREDHRILSPEVGGLFEPIIHDAVASIGPGQTRWLAARNEGRGISWLDYRNHRIQSSQGTSTLHPPPGLGGRSEPEFDFLLTTARRAWIGPAERGALERVLENCASALDRGGHRVLIRIFDEGLRAAVTRRLPRARSEETGASATAISRARCVIGTSSSLLLEAMQWEKPTATLVFRDSPLFYQTGWLLGPTADWEAGFESMLARDTRRMVFQRHSLQEQLSREDFFDPCRRVLAGTFLARPRPFDDLDRAFERRLGC
ncbi:MAG TPA: hypothetical protein ENI85_16660 [Deltaproteobacteria bacterium]|nr:hypothetical protein [Deltaproteobacteria bacterium]